MTRVSRFSIFLLVLIAFTNGVSNNRPQAPVQSQTIAQNSTALEVSGQVSGHIFRADTGTPVEGAVIFLQGAPVGGGANNLPPVRSNRDGSYVVSNVAAGSYVLMVYRRGFVGPVDYGSRSPIIERISGPTFTFCPPTNAVAYSCVSVTRGQKVGGIDVRLTENPSVATLPTDPIAATYRNRKIFFEEARFSPDGQILAINTGDELWLYDMRSHQSVPAILPGSLFVDATEQGVKPNIAANTPYVIVSDVGASGLGVLYSLTLIWASDDTLYAEGGSDARYTKVAATLAGAKEIEQFPSEIERPTESYEAMNADSAKLPGGPAIDEKIVDNLPSGDDVLLFDAESSLVLYSNPGRFFSGAIGAVDLKTGQTRTLALPYDYQLRLLDRTKAGVLAYSVIGPCVADDSVEQRLIEWTERGTLGSYSATPHLCFVQF